MKASRAVGAFRKDLKLLRRRRCDLDKLATVIDLLMAGELLPAHYRDHPLKGRWQGYRDCHIEPDWLLVYRDRGHEIELVRTGTHSDLFG